MLKKLAMTMANVTLMVNVIVMTTFLDPNANVSVTFKSRLKISTQYSIFIFFLIFSDECEAKKTCNDNGECNSDGKCDCHENFFGPECKRECKLEQLV